MEVRKDFGAKVEALCATIPAEAVANLLKALMPRVPVEARPARLPEPLIGDDWIPVGVPAPDPFVRRIPRGARVRKVISASTMVRATGARHKQHTFYWYAARIAAWPITFGALVELTAAAFEDHYKSSKPIRETTEVKLRDGLSKLGYFEVV